MTDPTLTATEAARRLGVNERTIRRAIERGELVATRSGRAFLIAERDLLNYAAAGRSVAPAARTHQPGELPAVRALIGRENDLALLLERLRSDGVRLVTITGPAGVGKTALAITALDSLRNDVGRTIFTDLAATPDATGLPLAVATAAGVQSGRREPGEALIDALAQNNGLLLLDNVEHLLDGAGFVETLLASLPDWIMLATSRAPFGISVEHVHLLEPLAVPPHGAVVSDLRRASPAVRMFVQQVQLRQTSFALTPDNAPTITEIVRRLDGLPLAIELAAPLLDRYSLDELLQSVERRFPVLIGGERSATARHRTLGEAIAWSFDLLNDDERRAMVRLAVPPAGLSAELAASLIAPEPTSIADPDLGSLRLQRLVDRSLVSRQGTNRYLLLESIREFAGGLPGASAEQVVGRRRLTNYLMELAASFERDQFGSGQVFRQSQLMTEVDNLRAALTWSMEDDDGNAALQILAHLPLFWSNSGLLAEGLDRTEQATAAAPGADDLLRACALLSAGWLAYRLFRIEKASQYISDALRLGGGKSEEVASRAETILGLLADANGELERAVDLHQRAAERARGIGDAGLTARALNNLGLVYLHKGDLDAAAKTLEACEALEREGGNTRGLAVVLTNLGQVAGWRGEMETAGERFSQSIELLREIGDRFAIYTVIMNLGAVQFHLGNLPEAFDLTAEAATGFRESGDRDSAVVAMINMAAAKNLQGDSADALTLISQAATLGANLGNPAQMAEVLDEAGRSLIRTGAVDQGVRTIAVATRIRDETGAGSDPNNEEEHARLLQEARSKLGSARFDRVFVAGRSLSIEQIVGELTAVVQGAGAHVDASRTPRSRLSARELDVLSLLAEGFTDQQIAEQLFLSKRTVSSHVASIMSKLGVESRTAAATAALRQGLI